MKFIVLFCLFTVCYGRWFHLRRSARPKIEHDCEFGIEKQTVDSHREAFALFDINGDHEVTPEELIEMAKQLENGNKNTKPLTLDVAKEKIAEGDKNQDGVLSESEWIEMFVNRLINQLDEDEFKDLFALFDRDQGEGLTEDEVLAVLKNVRKIKDPEAFVKALFKMYNCNHDDMINFREFTGFLANTKIMAERHGVGTPALPPL